MSTFNVKKLATTTQDIGGLNRSRYEKLQVSYGTIEASSYDILDTLVFTDVPSFNIVRATITAHASPSDVILKVYPGDIANGPVTLSGITQSTKLSYIIEYVRGNGSIGIENTSNFGEGQRLSVVIGNISGLSTSQIAGLTVRQVSQLNTQQIVDLTTAQTEALTTDQIQALTTDQISSFETRDIQAIETRDIVALTTSQVNSLTTKQIAAMKTSQLVALETVDVKALTSSQLKVLSTAQLRAFSTTQTAVLSTTQTSGLTTTQLAALQ